MKYSFRREDGTFLCNDGTWALEPDNALVVDTDWPDALANGMRHMVYPILSPYLNGERVIYILVEDTRGDTNPVYRDEMPLIFPLLDDKELDDIFTELWLRFEPLEMDDVLDLG